MKRTVGIAALVVALLLGGCGIGGEDQASPAPEATTASATEAPPAAGTPTAAEEPLPRGHCGTAPAPLEDQSVYQGTPETDCGEAMRAVGTFGRGDDAVDESGHGTQVDGWQCVFPMDAEVADYGLTLACEKGPQRFVVRPASVEAPAGYHVRPWDYEGTATGAEGIYFTTESRKHHCSFAADGVGCDNLNFPDDLPEVGYMGQRQQPTAIVLGARGAARFAAFGDPTFTQFSDSGGWGTETRVLGYGELLIVRGIACTTDEDRGVVCVNGDHGFAISSRDYSLD